MAEYSEIIDPGLQERVRKRYQVEIAALRALGFRHLAYSLETLGAYSAILSLPVVLLAFVKREVIVFPRPLRVAVANAILFQPDPPTIALCMGMGVKLYTGFGDKTLLISSDFKTYATPRLTSYITRLSHFSSIDATWRAHSEYALARPSQGTPISRNLSFGDYVEMSHREEDFSQYQYR